VREITMTIKGEKREQREEQRQLTKNKQMKGTRIR
jgi:hypothetical protein